MKRLLFTLLALSLPILALAGLEVILREAGFGTRTDLFLKDGDVWRVNPRAPARYFSHGDFAIPEVQPASFPRGKPDGTFRVFALGGSTTAGFPYEVNISFPLFLRHRIEAVCEGTHVEMINLGASAINSFTLRDWTGELRDKGADLVVIYAGHNEFYGPFGGASTESISGRQAMIQATVFLRGLRTYQGLQALLARLHPRPADKPRGLMEAMIGSVGIRRGTEAYTRTLTHFQSNLEAAIASLTTAHIPVVIGTVASNLRDQVPLEELAAGSRGTPPVTEAGKTFDRARTLLQAGRQAAARDAFLLARDQDGVRFRAPGDINRIIRTVGRESGVPVADVETAFSHGSEYGIPGNDLFLEHVHPNPSGYRLMAETFFQTIADNALLPHAPPCARTDPPPVPDAMLDRHTLLDEIIGEMKILSLVNAPPFGGLTGFQVRPVADKKVLELALAHRRGALLWDQAHFRLARYFEQRGRPASARAEYEAVLAAGPHPTASTHLGMLLERMGDTAGAKVRYEQALQADPTARQAALRLGRLLLVDQDYTGAVRVLQALDRQERNEADLPPEEHDQATYLYAAALAQSQDLTRARQVLERLLATRPDHAAAKDLLRQIEAAQSR